MFSIAIPDGAYSWEGFANGITVARQQSGAWTHGDRNGLLRNRGRFCREV
jgi:hypothetical protein